MKTSKKVFIIILSVLIVLTSFVAYVSGLLRMGVLSPDVYSKFMPKLHAYDSLYDGFTDYLLEPVRVMDVPESIQGVPEDLVRTAITKKDFNNRVGEVIGGGIGWLLYNHADVELPIEEFAENLKQAIASDERVQNSDTNISATMDAIVLTKLEVFIPNGEHEQTFRGYMHYLLTGGNQRTMDYFDYWVDVFFYYYGIRLSIITIASFVLLAILIAGLLLITKNNKHKPLKLAKVLCIFYAAVNSIIVVVLFALPWLSNHLAILEPYAKYMEFSSGVLNAFGALALVYTMVLIICAVIFATIEGNVKNKD